jgi:hypothetical protein
MHRALNISEVLVEIIDHLGKRGALETLAVLAVTCKALSRPALSRLWFEVDFWHFIELFGDVFVLNEYPWEHQESEMRRITVTIWFKLLEYWH